MMVIQAGDSKVPLFDTTAIHCEAAMEYALRP
jgi:aspartate/glutamate racemase